MKNLGGKIFCFHRLSISKKEAVLSPLAGTLISELRHRPFYVYPQGRGGGDPLTAFQLRDSCRKHWGYQAGCGVSLLGHTQKLSGLGPGKPAVGGPA